MKHYFVIGGGPLQLDFIKTVKSNGLCVHVIDYNKSCIGASYSDYFHCVSIDDFDNILELAKKYNPIGIHTVATEQGNITSCYVAERLGLNCNSFNTALDTTDKSRMKTVLYANNLDTPKAYLVKSKSELMELKISFPIMVKASDRSAGRGVTLARNYEELVVAYNDAFEQSNNKVVLIEEYFEGQQYSVETLTSKGKHKIVAITQMEFSGAPYFIEKEHFIPANISEKLHSDIYSYVLKSLDAFKIIVGASHIELRVDSNENIKMIEIASRMGGWRNWMINAALGINYCQAILDATLGKDINLERTIFNKISIARTIVSRDDYNKYILEKEMGSEFVVDLVHDHPHKVDIKNLMDVNGVYVLCKGN